MQIKDDQVIVKIENETIVITKISTNGVGETDVADVDGYTINTTYEE